jgi:uncharacterized protein with GYD domain
MIFITVIVIDPEKNREVYETLKKLTPPENIKITHAFGTFGDIDAILIYEAPDEKTAMDFLLNICKIDGIVDTETYVATELR